MGVSFNDRIKIGNFQFDLQTETEGEFIIGEIFHNGKVLKTIKRPRDFSLPEKTDVYNLHNQLKELLITKLTSTQKNKQESKVKILHHSHNIRKNLLEILELQEHNLEFFLYKTGDSEVISSINKPITTIFQQFTDELNERINKFSKFKNLKMLVFTTNKKSFLIILRYQETTILFLFSDTKLAIIRNSLKKNINEILSLLTKSSYKTTEN